MNLTKNDHLTMFLATFLLCIHRNDIIWASFKILIMLLDSAILHFFSASALVQGMVVLFYITH